MSLPVKIALTKNCFKSKKKKSRKHWKSMTPNRKNYKIELLMNQLTASFLVYKVRQLLGVIMLYLSGAKQREGETQFE